MDERQYSKGKRKQEKNIDKVIIRRSEQGVFGWMDGWMD